MALLQLVSVISSKLKLSNVVGLVMLFVVLINFGLCNLSLDVRCKIFDLRGFPGVSEELNCFKRIFLLLLGKLSVLAESINANNEFD